MLHETYFFDIPVYRCSPDTYEREIEHDKQKWLDYYARFEMRSERVLNLYNEHLYPGVWRFNQIIGYLRLFIDFGRNVIKAEYWRIENKRIPRIQAKKKFSWRPSNAIEVWFSENPTSDEIYSELLDRLKALQKEDRFKKRYVDLSSFQEVGAYINWRALLDG